MAQLVATNVYGVVMTSSPGPTLSSSIATCSAEVPLLKATQCSAPQNFAKSFSNCDHVRAEAERAVVEGARDGGVNFLAQRTDLRREVEVLDFFVHVIWLQLMLKFARAK